MKSHARASSKPPVTAGAVHGGDDRDRGRTAAAPMKRGRSISFVDAEVAQVETGAEGRIRAR